MKQITETTFISSNLSRKAMQVKWSQGVFYPVLFLILFFHGINFCWAQEQTDTYSTEIIDSAPKKLYSELYSDENANRYMVEIYEEPQEGNPLIHFRAFQNGKLIGRKSQALAESHDFTFYIDETEKRLMRPDVENVLAKVLKRLMEESDQNLKANLLEIFNEERMAKNISKNMQTPTAIINEIQLANQISGRLKIPDVKINEEQLANQISGRLKIPDVKINEEQLASTLAIKLTQKEQITAAKIPSYTDLLKQVSSSNKDKNYEKTIQLLNEDIAKRTPDEQRKALKISGLMSTLVGSKKLKKALSLIENYDLPEDPGLTQLSKSLEKWLSENLVVE